MIMVLIFIAGIILGRMYQFIADARDIMGKNRRDGRSKRPDD